MQLLKNEFSILSTCALREVGSQRDIAEAIGASLGTANAACKNLLDAGLLDKSYEVTPAGFAALEPYRVDNAIIMAAGFSSRFAPISYDKPKGVLKVRGEVLIERQIRQLQEAGIDDITVVVGYMKEAFFYLEDTFGVTIKVNDDYVTRNNNSTLMLVKEQLGNTYICSSDDYFTENVFSPYEYQAYYSAQYFEGETDEYCLTVGPGNRIVKVTVGGVDSYGMLGHVYFDRDFSNRFKRFLEDDYGKPETAGKLWEDIYIDHIKDLDMVMRPFEPGVIFEFDSLDDLRDFDHDFIDNVDSEILDNICSVLECERIDIVDIAPLKEGLTNLSFRFGCLGGLYVYRHPGAGTAEIINRESEAYSQEVAKRLGIDDTFIYEDPRKGWKLSRYLPDCVDFDYHNPSHVERGLALARRLHGSGEKSEWYFDVYEKAQEIVVLLGERAYPSFPDFDELSDRAHALDRFVKSDRVEPCLCHNDFYNPNFLVRDDFMYLIDWEYSAMSDYASDLGTFICCSDYTLDEARGVISEYFKGKPTEAEMRHCLAYTAISAYYWFVWALYKESSGDPVGEWLYLWYRAAKTYGRYAIGLYEAAL
ncbi:NTP transferase domain-containing protein [Raoultibacter timonensis]|uniref:Choline kinase n=1 Tax=Raoultibacter timonensis TaxID=1907662 RepID=A0ABM7WI92_9ACTN|nr:NTP transferase domain-containing protein [Raoultibacter timonensis]BDE96007.1 choline kinase [Raoultibacter timonensis]BDF50611.1 choline kinase [Raoultibacter timonensis]